MMIKLLKEKDIPLINIVRRQEQITLLNDECGARYILNSSDKNFDEDLYELSKKLGANVAIDAVAGEMTGQVL